MILIIVTKYHDMTILSILMVGSHLWTGIGITALTSLGLERRHAGTEVEGWRGVSVLGTAL